jgi:hypothetical protein
MAGNDCSRLISITTSRVRSWVWPKAPHVTDTNDGRSGASSWMVFSSWRWASSFLGGKNSKLSVGPVAS